jgi:hypothetical protein
MCRNDHTNDSIVFVLSYPSFYTKYDTIESNLDYISLSILLLPYYQLSVIVSYRRYYQWYPSAKQQQERYARRRYHYNEWPSSHTYFSMHRPNHMNRHTRLLTPSSMVVVADNDKEQNHHNTMDHINESMNQTDNNNNNNADDDHDDDDVDDEEDHHQHLMPMPHINNSHLTRDDGDENLPMDHSHTGILMEPLIPNYWKKYIPGQIIINHENPYNRLNGLNERTRQRQKHQRHQQQDHDHSPIASSYQRTYQRYTAIQNDIYWANTIGIPYHYTNFSYHSLMDQQRLMKDYAIDISYITKNNDQHHNRTTTHDHNDNHTADQSNHPTFNVVLFNLHELLDINNYTTPLIRTLFICHALPQHDNATYELCQYSKEVDKNDPSSELHFNPSIEYSTFDQLVTAAYLTGQMKQVYIHDGRHQTVLKTQRYYESIKQIYDEQNQNEGLGSNTSTSIRHPYEFPLICPTHDELEEFLNYSLSLEAFLIHIIA